MGRVLKVKYYPFAMFMDVSLGSHPSFLWRSIWAAKGLLQISCDWQVGDDLSISL